MAKIPKRPEEIFPEIITDYKNIFGDDLISIILYGSAAGQDYQLGSSDINFMMVLSEKGIEHLDLAFATIKKWRKRNVSVPLFLTENYVDSSLDSFPIEYLNFQRQYLLIYGKDILKDLTLNWDFIRLQCEREIKGKLLVLRRTFLETEGKGRAVKGVIRQSIPAFIAIFEALLFLKGKDRPEGKRGLIRGTAKAFDMDAGVFERLLDIREGKVKPNDTEIRQLFKDYLGEVRKLSVLIDTIGG